jgi:hypothetical protein
MNTRTRYAGAILTVAMLCVSCAVSPETQARRQAADAEIEAILNEPLDAEQSGVTQRCLSSHEYRNFRALDDKHILFEGRRGNLWINTLRMRCPDLRYGTVLRVRSFSSMGRICDMDSFVAGDWFAWPWYRRWPWHWGTSWNTGMTCSLGKFRPVTEAQVEAIEEAIRSR